MRSQGIRIIESATPLGKYSFDDEKLKKIRKDFNELRDKRDQKKSL